MSTNPTMNATPRKRLSLAIAQILLLGAIGSTQAATITVTSSLDDGTDCTLREAIANANSDTDNGANGCDAGSGVDTIVFDSSLSGSTITLGGTQLDITTDLSIDGDPNSTGAPDIEINANGSSRVLLVNAANVSLNGLTVAGGSASNGGGIRIIDYASVSLSNSTVSGNTANTNGGGILALSSALVSLSNSTVSGNIATNGNGGGIALYGASVSLDNSTVSGNSADIGGGISAKSSSSVSLSNSTVSGNSAVNGGGIYAEYFTAVSLSNSVIANSTGGDCSEYASIGGFASNINNHFEDSSCDGIATGNPQLGPLRNNGGPTLTHLPLTGSPLINAGDNAAASGLSTDQRGLERFINLTVDIGAVERNPSDVDIIVTSGLDDNGAGCTLREAIANANSDTDNGGNGCAPGRAFDTIVFDSSLSGSTITLGGTQLVITTDLNIDGDPNGTGAPDIEINANGGSRVLSIDAAKVNLYGLTLTGGAAGSGGGIRANNAASVSLSNSMVSGNNTTVGGGIALSSSSSISLSNSTVSGNNANSGGGIAAASASSVNLNHSTVSGNSVSAGGGGISANSSSVSLSNSTVSGNNAMQGGGIFAMTSAVSLSNSTVSGNGVGTGEGGGIYSGVSSIDLLNSTLSDNNAGIGSGIHIDIDISSVSLINSIIASGAGGDCFIAGGMGVIPTNINNHFEDATCDGIAKGDPLLGPLQNNGGPTLTHLPAFASPVIDAGDNQTCMATDQRAVNRPKNGDNFELADCDIGAVEVIPDICHNAVFALSIGPDTLAGVHTFQSTTTIETNGEVIVSNGSDISFESPIGVELMPGFQVQTNAQFTVRITAVTCAPI